MKITRTSPLTGKVNVMDLPITTEQMGRWRFDGELIQDAMPHLTKEQREFLKTGYTPEDWKAMFPEECGNCAHWKPYSPDAFDRLYRCTRGAHSGEETKPNFKCGDWQEEA